MSIDWQMLLSHTIGFLITLWLLSKFAWKPLLALMEERRSRIETEFRTIEEQKQSVAKQAAAYEQKLKEIEAEKRTELVKAADEGRRLATEIKAAAQAEAKETATRTKSEMEREVAKARVQLKNDMVSITMKATEKLVKEKLDDAKQRELIGKVIEDLAKA